MIRGYITMALWVAYAAVTFLLGLAIGCYALIMKGLVSRDWY